MSETIEVKQGDSVNRKHKEVELIPQEDIPTEDGVGLKRKKEKVFKTKPLEKRVKVTPYTDPNAKPPLKYKYVKIYLKPEEATNEKLDEILNTSASIIKWDEKVLNEGALIITIIYTERQPLPKENTNA